MRKIVWAIVFISVVGACTSGSGDKKSSSQAERVVTVRGKVGFPQAGEIKIIEMIARADSAAKPFEDTITLKSNYTYEKKIRIRYPGFYQINFYNVQFLTLMLDKADLEVNVDGNSPQGFADIKGSPDLALIDRVQKVIMEPQSTEEAKALEAEYQTAAQLNNEPKMEEIREKYMAIIQKAQATVAEIVRKEPPSLGLLQILQNPNMLDSDKYFDVVVESADKFKAEWPDNPYSREFVEMVEKLKLTAVGQPAPEISLPDPNGKTLKLSSFKGKYVLVDFWAKWCGPCRRENPNVVKAYHQFKDKGFDILGVSLDRTREDWLQAIQEDGLVWNHVSDLKYFESQAARDYNINGIPFSILVDPKGVIVAKNLRGPDLAKKLSEVLD